MPVATNETLTRAAGKASSFNPAERTVDLVFASEQPVRRRTWEGTFDEILVVSRQAIDASRIDSMALLDGHDSYSGLDSRLGSIVPGSLRFEGKTAIVTAKISRTEKGDQIVRDLEDGMSLPVSVGYRIEAHEREEAPAGGVATIRATKWTPLEISIVSIPADENARTRSHERTSEMPQQQTNDIATITRAERKRQADIRALAKTAGIKDDDALVTRAIDEDMDMTAFRSAMLDHLIAIEERSPSFPHSETRGMGDVLKDQIDARKDALVARMTGSKPSDAAREFMGASLLDHARGLLEAQGVDTRRMSREEVLGYRRGYHTSSDFPLLLQGAGERVLMDAYQIAQGPLKTLLSRRSTAVDFRAKSKLKITDAGLLEKVSETGEITSTTRSETSESYRIESYGRIFALSFQAIVNDDLGAFADWSRQAGQMAALTENKVLLDLLLSGSGAGPVMSEDSKRLFHADHGNLAASGTALDETNLMAAVKAFRNLTSFGGQKLYVRPHFLLVGPDLELPAQKLLAAISPTTTADAVPEAIKSLIPVVEPNLAGKSWYLFSDPALAPVFEWSHLAGHEGVQVDTREGFERLGTEFRAVLHFGAGAIDFRGAYRNPGV